MTSPLSGHPAGPPNGVASPAPLPLDLMWTEIRTGLLGHRNLVLVAEPGAGKTTRLPPALATSGLLGTDRDRILMLEPRRLAARAAAHRIAEERGWSLGERVGYQVRFENRTSAQTQITVLTEGLLSRRLQSDPELKSIGAVILDEFHERSLHTDLGLSLLFELQQLARPDLRLIVMSATLDAERVASFLGDCPIVRVPGRTFSVDIVYGTQTLLLDTGADFSARTAELILDILTGKKKRLGDVLVFLPGAREIRNLHEKIRGPAAQQGFDCFELHGSLTLEEQNRALLKSPRGKVILATNIAETSLTIDGVNTVVDTGLARVMRVDGLGFPRLYLSRISKASATQRSGRAGRQAEGLCYRLWNKLDDASMPPFEAPEILRAELSDALMTLASQGVTDFDHFSWFEKPRPDAIIQASEVLKDLGLISETGLTAIGHDALKIAVSPRLSRLLIAARDLGLAQLGAEIAALLGEKDIVQNPRDLRSQRPTGPQRARGSPASNGRAGDLHGENDLLLRLELLEAADRGATPAVALDRVAVRQVRQVIDSLLSQLRRLDPKPTAKTGSTTGAPALTTEAAVDRLLFSAFADRLCRRRRPGDPQARMVGGKGVKLAPFSTVETSDLFFALDAMNASGSKGDLQVTLASPIELASLERLTPLQDQTRLVFDEDSLTVQRETARYFRDLAVTPPRLSGARGDEASDLLTLAAEERWATHFLTHPSLGGLLARMQFVLRAANAEGESLDEIFTGDRRREFLTEICFGESRLNQVLEKNLEQALLRHLPAEWARRLEIEAPAQIRVPSGSLIPISYPANQNPHLEVRIQEIFGWRSTPRLAGNSVPLTIHLLSPGFRPVQVTSDLESFWKNGYVEVRKELRLRYPKHAWPEDPLSASPEAKGRRRI